ncbi:MAG: aminotransferase class V-fold PLP-dependent enzyme [Candidatus Thorarchaeota archaeon]
MTDKIDPQLIADLWPTLSKMTYLNNAATGIPPKNTFDAMKAYLDNKAQAIGNFEETLANIKTTRQLLAKLLGGDYSQYGFVASTSAGINSFAHSIEYPKGSNIVLCDLEFPANYVPWQNLCKFCDVELRIVKSVEGGVDSEAIKEKVDDNTRVLAISQIQFGTGFRSDLKELANLAHSHGALLSADIIQAAGCFDTNLVKSGVDFATGQSAKWLLGPIGAGYVFVSKSIMDEVKPRFLGWWGVEKIMEFGYFERTPLADARKYQIGSPAMIAYVGLLESLKTLLKIPGKTREQVAMSNADYLRKKLSEIGIPYYEFGAKNNSATVSCEPHDVEKLHEKMLKNRIHVSVRNGRLRISPHFYNNHEEIDTIIEFMR